MIPGFVIQGGGLTGDMSQKKTRQPIKNEATNGLKNERGSLSMARTNDINSATSQFFVNLKDNEFLDHKPGSYGYAVFGRVTEGMDVVDKIAAVQTGTRKGHHDVPVEDVVVTRPREWMADIRRAREPYIGPLSGSIPRPSRAGTAERSTARSGGKSFGARLVKWVAVLVLAFVVLTALPVLLHALVGSVLQRIHAARELQCRGEPGCGVSDAVSVGGPRADLAACGARRDRVRGSAVSVSRRLRPQVHSRGGARECSIASARAAPAPSRSRWRRICSCGTERATCARGWRRGSPCSSRRMWPKERILEVYLNIAQFGRGVYGVEAASQRFYRKPAARLTRAEAATLAAVLPNPVRMHAERPSRYVAERRDWIMGQMRGLGGREYLEEIAPPPEASPPRK